MPRFPQRLLSRVLRHAWIALVAALAATTMLAACKTDSGSSAGAGGGGGQVVVNSDAGVDVYLRSCSRCHGSNREGAVDAPALDTVRIFDGQTLLQSSFQPR